MHISDNDYEVTVVKGTRIKALRKIKGMSQSQLAEALGVQQTTVARWERGIHNPIFETQKQLAHILGTSVSYLIGETDPLQEPKDHEKGPTSEEIGPSVDIVLPSGRTVALTPGQLRAYENWQKDRDLDKTLALAATLGIPLSDMVPRETSEGYPTERHRNLAAIVKLATAGHCRDALPERDADILRRIAEEDICHILAIVRETLRWKLDQIFRDKKGDR